jgi:hypothetical protein
MFSQSNQKSPDLPPARENSDSRQVVGRSSKFTATLPTAQQSTQITVIISSEKDRDEIIAR